MPATIEPPAATVTPPKSTYRSFAEMTSESGDPEPEVTEPSVEAVAKLPVKATEKPETKAPETKPATDLNPHLEEPAAKPEPKPAVQDDEVPAGMTKKAQETWKSLKHSEKTAITERDAAKGELTTLRKQLEDAGKNAPEIERLKKELDDTREKLSAMEGELAIGRVEATRQYKERVAAPIKAGEETAAALAAKYQIEPAEVLRAISETDPDKRDDLINELIADFKPSDQHRLIKAGNDYAAAQAVAADLRTNASAKLDELSKQEQKDEEAFATANAGDYRKTVAQEWKALQERIPWLRSHEGKPEWNAHLDGLRQEIESVDVNNLPIADVARAKVFEKAMPELQKVAAYFQTQNKELREKLAAAEERIKDYVKIEPGAGAGSTTRAKAQESGSFLDSVFAENGV